MAGLTKFQDYQGHIDKSVFVKAYNQLYYSEFLFQCLFEAQSIENFLSAFQPSPTTSSADQTMEDMEDISSTFQSSLVVSTEAIKNPREVFFSFSLASSYGTGEDPVAVVEVDSTSLDAYALGYCIANFSIGVAWRVSLEGNIHHSFTCGLQTKMPNVGSITGLNIMYCSPLDISELKLNPLDCTTQLSLMYCELTNHDMIYFSELIPSLTSLKALSLHHNRVTDGQQDGLLKVLHQLCDSSVTELHIPNTGLGELLDSPHDYSSVLKRLLKGKIEVLGIGHFGGFEDRNDDKIADILSADLSVNTLGLFFDDLSPHSHHLKSNTYLMALGLFFYDLPHHVHELVDILNCNKTLLFLGFFIYNNLDESNISDVRSLVSAVHGSKNLMMVVFFVLGFGDSDEAVSNYMNTHHEELTFDHRIIWKHNNH